MPKKERKTHIKVRDIYKKSCLHIKNSILHQKMDQNTSFAI
jgi:hypothetical protein